MSDEGLDLSSLDPGGPHRFWYQSRTVCRKTLLLVGVESSVCENYFKAKKISVKTLSRLLFTPYLVSLYFRVTLPRVDLKSFAIFSHLSKSRCLFGRPFQPFDLGLSSLESVVCSLLCPSLVLVERLFPS
jgi:hypothetical protein